MFQIDNSTAAPARPAAAAPGSPGWFTGGNPAGGVPATKVSADWLNMIQGELLAVLSAAGITPDKTQGAQVVAAILALVGQELVSPSAGDNSLKNATTTWVDNLVGGHGVINVSGAGNIVLTAAQAGVGILLLTGAITADIAVILPNTGRWYVYNGSTGAHVLTCRTAAGSGYVVRQGFGYRLYGDGVNIDPEGEQVFYGTAAVGALAPALQLYERYGQYT